MNLTLQEGLEDFHKKNEKYFSKRSYSNKGLEFLKCHDTAHVVFGCNTTIYGEGIVKIWSIFGTDLGFWKAVTGYREVRAFSLFRTYSFSHVLKNLAQFLVTIPTVINRSRQMTKPWKWSEYKSYLNKPVSEIRKEFNIKVVNESYPEGNALRYDKMELLTTEKECNEYEFGRND